MIKLLVTSLVLFASISPCEAKVSGLFTWATQELQKTSVTLLFPQIEGFNPEQIVDAYKRGILTSDHYVEFRPNLETVLSALGNSKTAPVVSFPKNADAPLRLVTVANRPNLLLASNFYSSRVYTGIAPLSTDIYIVPFGVETLLTHGEDLTEYLDLISHQFPVMLSVGGYDLDPAHYHQKNTHARYTNFYRDEVELKLIKNFVETNQGTFYGICRGMQAFAVATGGELFQDLSLQNVSPEIHSTRLEKEEFISSWHEIETISTNNALYEAVGASQFLVNSRHHQSVKRLQQGRPVALAHGNVVEAIENRDQQGNVRVLAVQFHPEDMNTDASARLLRWMGENARRNRNLTREVNNS